MAYDACRFPRLGPGYAVFRRWRRTGLVKELHDRLRGKVRVAQGRQVEPTAGIIDSQSVKAAASVPAASRGYDGGKKIHGRRRHVIADTLGLILMVMVTAANVTDRQATRDMLPRLRTRFRKIALVWADGGYTGRLVGWAKEKLQLTVEIVKRNDGMNGFVVLPRRWVVERTMGWLMRSRRLVRDFEALPAGSEAFIDFSATMLCPPPGPHRPKGPAPQPVVAGEDDARGVNRPVGDAASQSRSASRFARERTPSIFAGTSSSPNRAAISFAEIPSAPAAGSASTNSTIRR